MSDGLLRSRDSTALLAKGTIIKKGIGMCTPISKLVNSPNASGIVLNYGMHRIFWSATNEVAVCARWCVSEA
jgi:hypothetical protein